MKKIIIVVLFALASGALIRSMQEAATSSTASTAQTTSKKRPASDDDDNDNPIQSTSQKAPRTTNLIKIPMVVQTPATCPEGMIENNTLYLDLSSDVPVLGGSFAELITEHLKENKPVILAVTTTKFNGVYTYHIYEAAATKWFYGNNFSRNRYSMTLAQFPTEPTNRQSIINEVMFFILYDINKPVEYIGSDYDLFQGTDDQKLLLESILLANDGDLEAIIYVGTWYYLQNKLDLAEQCFKQAADKGSVHAMFNLGHFYDRQNKLDLAEQYYKQAADKGDRDAIFNLGNLYKQQNRLDLAEQYYKQAADKGHLNAIINLGSLYHQQNRIDLAEQYFKQALETLRSNPDPELEALINQHLADIAKKRSEVSQ